MALSFKAKLNLLIVFVVLRNNNINQMVYKHAISTIVPAAAVKLPSYDEDKKAEDKK